MFSVDYIFLLNIIHVFENITCLGFLVSTGCKFGLENGCRRFNTVIAYARDTQSDNLNATCRMWFWLKKVGCDMG